MANTVLGAKAMRIQPAPKVCMSKAKERGVPINAAGVLASASWTRSWVDGGFSRSTTQTIGMSSLAGDVNYQGVVETPEGGFWRIAILGDYANSLVQAWFQLVQPDGTSLDWSYPYFPWTKELPANFLNVAIPSTSGEEALTGFLYLR